MASKTVRISGYTRECHYNTNAYYNMWYYADVSWTESYDSDNTLTASNFTVTLRRNSTDYGYFSTCPSEDCVYAAGCTTNFTVYVATSLSSSPSWSSKGSYNYKCSYPSATLGTYSIPGSLTIAPGSSRTIAVARGGACSFETGSVTITNSRSKPTPAPPSVTARATCSSANYNTATFSASVSYNYCNTQSNSTTYVISDSNGNTIRSGSGTSVSIGTLQANSTYSVTFTTSNGCYTRSSSASVTTATGNTISDATAKAWDTGSVRVVPIMGGNVNTSPKHQVQIKPCTGGSWTTVATSNATAPFVSTFGDLTEESCYQVRCVTSNGSGCTYTSEVLQFNTPKKGLCLAEFTSITTGVDNRCSSAYANICYSYETLLTPADITVYYRVKDGYDDTWLTADTRTINDDKGAVCFKLEGIFPNQVVYETYFHTHTAEVDWDSDITTFTTELCPEVASDNCASLTYMTELLCASVKKLYKGNKKIYANPYSQKLCDQYSQDPTHLAIWSRYLRLAHAYLCILCSFINLSSSHEGQYLVGEVGWTQILTEIVESEMEQNGWKLATSDAIYKYIHERLKQVWHYQGTVDVMVANVADLENYPDATSAIVTSEDAIYDKTDGNWAKNTELVPEDFGVWHINYESNVAKAESGWYYWGGTWNNLDADLGDLEEIIEKLEQTELVPVVDTKDPARKIAVVDKSYDFSESPDANIIYFVTESADIPEPIYHTVSFVDEEGNVLYEEQVVDGALASYPNYDGRPCKLLSGDYTLPDGTVYDFSPPVKSDLVIAAGISTYQYQVYFSVMDDTEGTLPDPITVECGSTITLPGQGDLALEGKTFGGWRTYDGVIWGDTRSVLSPMTLYPYWEAIILTVAIRRSEGVPDEIVSIAYGQYLTPPEPETPTGYIFVGWFTESGQPFDFTQPITENTVIVAQYEVENVTVTFNAQTLPPEAGVEVDNPASQTLTRGSMATEPVIVLEDYILDYWALNGVEYNFDTPVTDDITLNAVWAEAVEVVFDADGGTPEPATQKVPNGGYAIKPEDPVKENCEFTGWSEQETHIVTFDDGYGNITKVHVDDGEQVTEPENPVDPEGECTFEGWEEEE